MNVGRTIADKEIKSVYTPLLSLDCRKVIWSAERLPHGFVGDYKFTFTLKAEVQWRLEGGRWLFGNQMRGPDHEDDSLQAAAGEEKGILLRVRVHAKQPVCSRGDRKFALAAC